MLRRLRRPLAVLAALALCSGVPVAVAPAASADAAGAIATGTPEHSARAASTAMGRRSLPSMTLP